MVYPSYMRKTFWRALLSFTLRHFVRQFQVFTSLRQHITINEEFPYLQEVGANVKKIQRYATGILLSSPKKVGGDHPCRLFFIAEDLTNRKHNSPDRRDITRT